MSRNLLLTLIELNLLLRIGRRISHCLRLYLRGDLFEILIADLHRGHLEVVLVFTRNFRLLCVRDCYRCCLLTLPLRVRSLLDVLGHWLSLAGIDIWIGRDHM